MPNPSNGFEGPYLEVKFDVERDGRLGEEVALEVEQETVEAAFSGTPVEELAARLQQRQHQPNAEHVARGVQRCLLLGQESGLLEKKLI